MKISQGLFQNSHVGLRSAGLGSKACIDMSTKYPERWCEWKDQAQTDKTLAKFIEHGHFQSNSHGQYDI